MRERGMFFNKSTKLGNSEVRATRLGKTFASEAVRRACKGSGKE